MIQDYHVKENDENLITCRIEMQDAFEVFENAANGDLLSKDLGAA